MRIPRETPAFALADLLRRLAAGDTAARDRLVDLCGMRIRALANRMLSGLPGGGQCAEDDETLSEAKRRLDAMLAALGRVPPGLALGLAAVAHERAILELTARYRPPLPLAASGAGSQRWRKFFRSVERLPPLHREVFRLVWLIGADTESVCHLTGRSRRTVHRCWREARARVSWGMQHPHNPSEAKAPAAE